MLGRESSLGQEHPIFRGTFAWIEFLLTTGDLLQEMSQRMNAGGNIFSGDLIAGDRFSADQQTVERARDPKIIRRGFLACFLGAIFVGVGGDHVPFPRSELYSYLALRNRRGLSIQRWASDGRTVTIGPLVLF